MSNFSADNMMQRLPRPLREDSGMNPLGETAGKALEAVWANVSLPNIYARIDSLPEWLLDVLAKDLKVDWYDYECELEQKRRLIKDSFYVHRHMGTKGAIERAVSDVWPYTTIEEWFEYGGNPFYFRVLLSLDVTGTVGFDRMHKMVNIFKPARAHLDEALILMVHCRIAIRSEKSDDITYHVPRAGTIPRYIAHGDAENRGLDIACCSESAGYNARRCGTNINSLM